MEKVTPVKFIKTIIAQCEKNTASTVENSCVKNTPKYTEEQIRNIEAIIKDCELLLKDHKMNIEARKTLAICKRMLGRR